MKKTISILIGKLILKLGLLLKKNMSVFPGHIALKLNKNILGDFILPSVIIAVTGSSGKGSTTKLINNILCDNGIDSIYNDKDSNKDNAIISLFLNHCNLKGKINKKAVVLEIDERYAKYIFPHIKPTHVVITNLTRDQPPRQGHCDLVKDEIKKALTKDMHLILNGDDPYLLDFSFGNSTFYSLSKMAFSYKNSNFNNLNINYCPKCLNKLKYNFYHIESTGDYYCENCDFKKPVSSVVVDLVNVNKNNMIIKNQVINLNSTILYDIYNTAAAFTVASLLNISYSSITKTINTLSKKNNSYTYQGKNINILSTKNENSTTFNQALYYINRFKKKKNIIIGWKEISRRYNHFDISWLYDIDFESLKNIDTIICVGINNFDIATRIKYAKINCKIICFESLNEAVAFIKKKNKLDLFGVLNFDYVKPFNDLLKEGQV